MFLSGNKTTYTVIDTAYINKTTVLQSQSFCIFFPLGQFLYDQKRVVEAATMFTKAMELAPGDFEIAFTAAGYLRYFLVKKENRLA